MTDIIFAYIPCGSHEEAVRIGQACVKAQLAACANILPAMTSIYEWKEEIHTEQEFLLLVKTKPALKERLSSMVQEKHSYELPCVIFLPVESGNEPYLEWVRKQTKTP